MGQADLYPFVLAPATIAKLGYIHDLTHRSLPSTSEGAQRATIPPKFVEQTPATIA